MADFRERGFDEKLNTWVQTTGIIIAALWGFYTFVWKEYWVPQSVPVNASVSLKLQKTGEGIQAKKQEKGFDAIEINISAKNPSSQITHLFPSVFIIYGYKIMNSDPSLKNDIAPLNEDSIYNMKHVALSDPTIVAWGYIIGSNELKENDELKPGELVARTFVFYVPVGKYDLLLAYAFIPNGKDIRGFELDWVSDTDRNGRGLIQTMFKITGDNREPIPRDETGGYSGLLKHKWQTARSMSMLSLW
jgi:hypothetical protein